MSDLISRSAVIDIIHRYSCNTARIEENVLDLPTAYDISKVVAELEAEKEKIAKEDYCRTKNYVENDCEHKDCFKCCAEHLIDIVRKGGVE